MTENNECCGSGPHTAGQVRVYPLGGGGNLILCRHCWAHENRYRYERQQNYMHGSKNVVDDRKRGSGQLATRELERSRNIRRRVNLTTSYIYGDEK